MRILIASDGSKWAQKSARFALQLFRHTAHELTILVFKKRPEEVEGPRKAIAQGAQNKKDNVGAERAPQAIEQEAKDLVEELAIEEIEWRRDEGDMAGHLLDIADEYDLLCLGGVGKGVFSQNMLGMIVDKVVMEGHGNLLVTKKSETECQDVLVALPSESLENEALIHYLGTLFQGSSIHVTIHVLWEALPERFEGYLEATSARKMKKMVDEELFSGNKEKLQNLVDIIESYDLECSASFQDYESVEQLIDHGELGHYDLIVVHPPAPGSGFVEQLEPKKQSLNLMRKSTSNVLLLRSIPARKK